MPPVSQFPPARVFLKNASAVPTPISTMSTARRSTLTSPISPRYTTASSGNPTQTMAQIMSQRPGANRPEGQRRATN
ncbi:hypothetical protein GMOD_00005664 [Pyrenophora seminiperda CCB06]|uniref:Uncharacterized protein n=1 Tax=Pyrenophora seminiperda CCB06 TaxID=1302712 RepID=A0A3M7M9L3_9PLEO|nr:hypothetical protein GMOD_00005664 [Pyrenophora seminiperda CCB06]